jgi:secreted trypsin-like serine protease
MLSGCWASPSAAIIMRHDRDDQQFLELARQFPPTASIRPAGATRGTRGMGTLIAPQWILTAAHVAVNTRPGDLAEVSGIIATIDEVILHPDWHQVADLKSDIALLRLKSAIPQVIAAEIHTQTDEAGMFVTFVGRGSTGTGLTGDTGQSDTGLRAATNRVAKADGSFLQFRFDAPEDSEITHLEGISGSGDSGGAAYLERAGKLYVIGVSSWQDTKPTNRQQGRYGVVEYYVRVSLFADWIRATIAGRAE